MSSAHDAESIHEEAFLREVARLLPGVDVVRLRMEEPRRLGNPDVTSGEPLTAGESLEDAAVATARHLVGAWSAVFDDRSEPKSLSVGWTSLGAPDRVHAQVTARAAAGAGSSGIGSVAAVTPDPDGAATRLRRHGWATAIRSRSSGAFSLLGRRDEFRLDVVVHADGSLRSVRVTGPPVDVGGLASRLVSADRREMPWPSRR